MTYTIIKYKTTEDYNNKQNEQQIINCTNENYIQLVEQAFLDQSQTHIVVVEKTNGNIK